MRKGRAIVTVLLLGAALLGGCEKDGKAPERSPSATAPAAKRVPPPTAPATRAAPGPATRGKIKMTKVLLQVLENALEMYRLDIGQYPTADQGLAALVKRPDFDDEAVASKWAGPYVKKLPKDPWGNAFLYAPLAPAKPYTLYSLGPDGQEGTADDISLDGEDRK